MIIIFRVIMLHKQKKISDEKTRFFINTAHDIRTPLTLIKAPLEEVVGSALGALPHFCGRFPRACPRTVLTCLHVHGSPL